MILTRELGSFLRGNATPFQLYSACILGGLMGFSPGFDHAPGMMLVFSLLLLVLNANLPVAALWGLLGALISYFEPVQAACFHLGRWLIDGPTSSLFTWLINAPVFAWFGFENYVATGSLVLGLIYGVLVGWLVTTGLQRFRAWMAHLQKDSARYQAPWPNPGCASPSWCFSAG